MIGFFLNYCGMVQPFSAEYLLHAYVYLGALWRLAMLYCMLLHWGIYCVHCVFYHFPCCTTVLFWPQVHTLTQHWHYPSRPQVGIRTTTATWRPVHSTNLPSWGYWSTRVRSSYTSQVTSSRASNMQYSNGHACKHACIQRDLESFLGHLSHAATVTPQGRVFLHQLFPILSRPSSLPLHLSQPWRPD